MQPFETFHLSAAGEQAFGYAQAIRSGNLLYVSGTLSVDATFAPLHPGDMPAQVRQVYDGIRRTLAHFGVGLDAVVKETMYVTDMEAFLGANGERIAAYAGHLPTSTAVEVKRLAFAECLVEIEVTANLANAA